MTATYAPQFAVPAEKTGSSKKALWVGYFLSGFPSLFLIVDGAMKVLQADVVMKGANDLGYPPSTMFGIGLVLLLSVALYVVPRTSVIGAVFLTGYLGGAIATHVRVDHPLFSHTLFPIYVAAFLWLGLWLRNEKLRAVVPFLATK